MKTIDAADLFTRIEYDGPEYFFNNYVSRDTELTFDGEQSKLVSKVDREAMRVSFEGAKRFYHTADSYMTDLEKTLAKYELT